MSNEQLLELIEIQHEEIKTLREMIALLNKRVGLHSEIIYGILDILDGKKDKKKSK